MIPSPDASAATPTTAARPRRPAWEGRATPVIVVLLVGLSWASLVVQATAAAYIRGESMWTKGEKRAVLELHAAAAERRPPDLARIDSALATPLADRRARLALESGAPDMDQVARDFVAGGNAPRDAARMARLYPMLARVPDVRRAIAEWERGDLLLDSLRIVAHAIHARGAAGATPAQLARVMELDARLTTTELAFSALVGDAVRSLPTLLGLLAIGLGAGLATANALIVRRARRLERLAADEEHRRAEEFRTLVEDAPDLIMRLDPQGRRLFANPVAERLLGSTASASAVDGATPVSGGTPELAGRWRAAVERVARTGEPVELDVSVPTADGARELAVRLAPQYAAAGHVASVIAVGRDMTELRAAARTLRERDEQLRQSQKMEAVGQLAGGIAHDFNNILTAIIASLELAREELPERSEPRADVDAAILAARRATSLTRQLLTFGRQQFVEPARIDLNVLVGETQTMLRRMVGQRVALETTLHPRPLMVTADPTQLQQVLVNLVVNARDALADDRGTIVIETGQSGDATGAKATLVVRDTGKGMSAATRERAFEPFFTTKPRGQGTGLGLSIVHGIVTQAGGSVSVESAPGRGTSVRVEIPQAPGPATPPHGVETMAGERVADGPPVTVLLVEDEAPVRDAVRRMLERAGHRVLEAKHAEDALLLWTHAAREVDLVVTDLMMPGMDGWALLRALRADRPRLPAVVISGYTGKGDAAQLAGDAPTLTLPKPFTGRDLMARVREALRTTAH